MITHDACWKKIEGLLTLIAGAFLLVHVVLALNVVLYPYQHEYREAAPLLVVRALLDGRNPYSFEVQPAYTYVYGLLYPLLSTPISKALGLTLANARIMSWLCAMFAALLVFRFSRRATGSPALAGLLAAAFLFSDPQRATAQPDDLGVLLLVGSMLVPLWGKFSLLSLSLGVLLSILGFYTKSYYLIGIGYTAAYLFIFRSKGRAIIYFVSAIALLALSMGLINRILPAYLNNCFFHHLNMPNYSFAHLADQLKDYGARNLFLLAIAIGLLVASLRAVRDQHLGLSLLNPRRPLVTGVRLNLYFEVSALVIFSLWVWKLGGHVGGGRATYLNRMLSPVLVLMVAGRLRGRSRSVWSKRIAVCFLLAFLVFACRDQYALVRRLGGYRQWVAVVERALAEKQNVLNSPNTVSILLEQGKPIYESGQSVYFITGDSGYARRYIYGNAIPEAQESYLKDVEQKVEAQFFDAVLVPSLQPWSIPRVLSSYYQRTATYHYPALWGDYPVDLWVPN
jgi:hypothetical protein